MNCHFNLQTNIVYCRNYSHLNLLLTKL